MRLRGSRLLGDAFLLLRVKDVFAVLMSMSCLKEGSTEGSLVPVQPEEPPDLAIKRYSGKCFKCF